MRPNLFMKYALGKANLHPLAFYTSELTSPHLGRYFRIEEVPPGTIPAPVSISSPNWHKAYVVPPPRSRLLDNCAPVPAATHRSRFSRGCVKMSRRREGVMLSER